jgi:hypothetical protein
MDPSLDICSGIFHHPGKDRTISVRRDAENGADAPLLPCETGA